MIKCLFNTILPNNTNAIILQMQIEIYIIIGSVLIKEKQIMETLNAATNPPSLFVNAKIDKTDNNIITIIAKDVDILVIEIIK